jgi:hypothetical protein
VGADLDNFQNALQLCSVPTLKKDKNMANIIKGSVVSVDTGKKATTGKGVVQSINTATDMIKVKLDSGTVATVDSSDVTLFKNKPAAATSKKPAAAAKPAPKRRAAPAVEEPEADEIVKGSTVSFTDDDAIDEFVIVGEVIALLPNDRAKVKDEDGNIYKVDVSDLTLEEPEAEEADADAAADAEGETEIVKGSEVSWTDDDGDDQTGKVFKPMISRISRRTTARSGKLTLMNCRLLKNRKRHRRSAVARLRKSPQLRLRRERTPQSLRPQSARARLRMKKQS